MKRTTALVDRLLDALNNMVPIPISFRFALSPLMEHLDYTHKHELLKPGVHAMFAWFILSGLVVGMEVDELGNESVTRIYVSGDIFSDLPSFLDGKLSNLRLVIIGSAELLYIKRSDYKTVMEEFAVTHKLVRFIQFREQAIERERTLMMSMGDENKFAWFTRRYPIDLLPNVIGSSFLKMTEPHYSTLKAAYNKEVLRARRK